MNDTYQSHLTNKTVDFNKVSPAVHARLLLASMLRQRLDSRGIEALILILEKSSTADITLSSVRYCFPVKCFCLCWGTMIN